MPYLFNHGLDPRKLPRGRFAINRGHRLGRNLVYANFPGSIYGNQDLTGNQKPALYDTGFALAGTSEGPGNYGVAQHSGLVVPFVNNLTALIAITGGSIIWRGLVIGPALNAGSPGGTNFDIPAAAIFSYTSAYSANWFCLHNDGAGNGGLVVATNSASTQVGLGPYALPTAGLMHSYGGTIVLNNTLQAYLDGTLQGSVALVSSPVSMPDPAIFMGAYTNLNSALSTNTTGVKTTIYSEALTAGDFAQEAEEPYCMLEPYGERLFFPPTSEPFALTGASITASAGNIGKAVPLTGVSTTTAPGIITVGATPSILPNDPNIIYSPYNWNVTSASATAINQGAYFRFRFSGTTISLHFNISQMTAVASQIAYRIDTGPWTRVDVVSNLPITVPSVLAPAPNHMLEVRLVGTTAFQFPTGQTGTRWYVGTPPNVAVIFTGITLGVGESTSPSQRRKRNIIFYGDSIMEGYYCLWNTGPSDCAWADGMWTMYFEAGIMLDAEFGVVACAGQGFYGAGVGSTPAFTNTYNLIYNGVGRGFTPVPDLIVINMGANDNVTIITMVTAVLNGLLTYCPTTPIMVMRPLNGHRASDLIAGIAACSNPSQVSYTDTTGWFNTADSVDATHPDAIAHTTVLAPYTAAAMNVVINAAAVTFVINRNTNIYMEEDTYVS